MVKMYSMGKFLIQGYSYNRHFAVLNYILGTSQLCIRDANGQTYTVQNNAGDASFSRVYLYTICSAPKECSTYAVMI